MDKIIKLYQKLYLHTLPECEHTCKLPRSCCSPEYCHFTIEWAKTNYEITLQPTSHPTLPLMGANGCIAAPHLRPACTLHTCEINSSGYKRGDPAWTRKYFRLRGEIEKLEFAKASVQAGGQANPDHEDGDSTAPEHKD
jgi:hypothetical protein